MAPAGKTPETGTGPCGGLATCPLYSSGAQERCPVRVFKETDGMPTLRSIRTAVVNMGSPKGRESYGDGVPISSRRGNVRPIWRPLMTVHRAKGHRR
jgi:hypothetical protein